ncbi:MULTISPECIES: aminopeptidase P family protein [Mesorhizobium]|uniref:Aminopeptidase P family protein n=1 Tax=Mesorhizobium denitrificans TaxID=2294114 RepID=A0A371XG50_9HYPH|nr:MULTISPECIES: aminopeptidase P family protein [Mesorhizobium]RFC68208.1 aminopeptidase P family protein [Mesorhizobium denitrificans]
MYEAQFQDFEVTGDPSVGVPRVALLREWLAKHDLDGFIVPRSDEHQGEYVAPCSERLRWLTGFSGSAGVAIVLRDRAVIFVDGRYTLQVRHQADMNLFKVESLVENPPAQWLAENVGKGARIAFDPWLHTIAEAAAMRRSTARAGAELLPLEQNPIDAIWKDRPRPPLGAVTLQPNELAGELARDKLARLAEAVAKQGADYAVLTDPSSIAWAFNIRGADVPHTPLALGFAVIAAKGPHLLFIDERKLGIEAEAYLTQLADLRAPDSLEGEIAKLAKAGSRISLDPVLAADRLRMIVEGNGGKVVEAADPARLPRATKKEAELAGSRAAHRRDGAAVVRFLCWLDAQQPGTIDEITAVTRLEEARHRVGEETQRALKDVSFETISGSGPNGAIIHYRVSRASNRQLGKDELFLLDSGAQYQDGTTDITRTIAIGTPSDEMRERFTLVLQGLMAISRLRFPPGTRGSDLDAFARYALWQHGFDYAHGTGHGVGSYLAVHEGPQRLAKTGTEKLLTGMILSNEPGYYKEGHYGIRCENLIVVDAPSKIENGDIEMHSFETLTLAPFDRRLVRADLLSTGELSWLNAYHARVLAEIGPMVDGETLKWLEAATAPIG